MNHFLGFGGGSSVSSSYGAPSQQAPSSGYGAPQQQAPSSGYGAPGGSGGGGKNKLESKQIFPKLSIKFRLSDFKCSSYPILVMR